MNANSPCLLLVLMASLSALGVAQAEMTLVRRQMFGTTGVLDAGTAQNGFQEVSGRFHQRPGGPSVGGSPPASGDLRFEEGSVYGKFVTESTAGGRFFLGSWFFVKALRTPSAVWLAVCDANGNAGPVISESQGRLGAGLMYGSWTPLPAEPVNQWIFLGVAVSRQSGNTGSVRFYYRFPGQPMSQWAAIDSASIGISSLGQFVSGCLGNNAASQMRLGAPSLYTFSSANFLDVTYPADLAEPGGRLTWYCNPATGDDGNDGQSPATAWKTAAKINQESQCTGFLSANSHTAGDTLVINTGAGMLDLDSTALNFQTSGLNVRAAEGQEWIRIKSYRTLPAEVWQPSGLPNVYATTDTQTHTVVWEEDRFLNHPTGALLQDVASSLSSVPGSFWTDGTTMYLHPFGSTDPRSDGKRYERSCNWGAAAAVMLSARHLSIRDLHIGKTCLAASPDNDPVGGYCVGTGSGLGQAVIRHCYLYYGSKHNIGITVGDAGDDVIIEDVQAEQGSPYAGPGGQTLFVSYNHQYAALGIVHRYRACRTQANAGVIGSTQGIMTPYYPVFYSHNQGMPGEPEQFARLEFVDCDFGNGVLGGGAAERVLMKGTRCGQVSFSGAVEAERCEFRGMILSQSVTSGSVTEKNCVHILSDALAQQPVAGEVSYQGCTFDARDVTGAHYQTALFNRSKPIDFTFHNNLILMPPAATGLAVFSHFESSDGLNMSHNAYSLQGSTFAQQFASGASRQDWSLSEWQQQTGGEPHSLEVANISLDQGLPVPGSVLIDAGLNLGPAEDMTGKIFQVRNDIGAFETPPATFEAWQEENFPEELLEHPDEVSETAAFTEDGISNLEKYFSGSRPDEKLSRPFAEAHWMQGNGSGGLLELRLRRSRYRTDTGLKMEVSEDLCHWTELHDPPQSITTLPEQTEELVFHVQAGGQHRLFFRCSLSRE